MSVADYIFIAFPAMFVILNPFSASSAFLTLTATQTEEEQLRTAKIACITAFVVLVVFGLTGHVIFKMFNITLQAFR
ncbi:MAG: MarC family protein, partial [Deltaproteobacteria bacterium]|nr:MarC family protein [Deltaproteobacteria bacterium]